MRQFRSRPLCSIPDNAHPLVKRLYEEMLEQRVGLADLAERSGVDRNTINAWRNRQSPNVANLEACFNALGRRLTDVPMDQKRPLKKTMYTTEPGP